MFLDERGERFLMFFYGFGLFDQLVVESGEGFLCGVPGCWCDPFFLGVILGFWSDLFGESDGGDGEGAEGYDGADRCYFFHGWS